MATYAQDWTGSAAARRPQGICPSPQAKGPVKCEWIPAGTPVLVRPKRGARDQWRRHVTRRDLGIEETIKRTSSSVIFAVGNWAVSVALKHVRPARELNGDRNEPLAGRSV